MKMNGKFYRQNYPTFFEFVFFLFFLIFFFLILLLFFF